MNYGLKKFGEFMTREKPFIDADTPVCPYNTIIVFNLVYNVLYLYFLTHVSIVLFILTFMTISESTMYN